MRIFEGLLVAAFAVAYGAIAAGLLGVLEARAVSLWTICAGGVALVVATGYFALAVRDIKRHFSSAA